jgi:hypothetical protein
MTSTNKHSNNGRPAVSAAEFLQGGGQMYKIILTVVLLLSLPALSYAAPAIHFNEVAHDFGKVTQDDRIDYVFEFRNTGNQTLTIEKVIAS